ncbi:MAG: MCE family protein [Maricaulaceae bacterium]|nr:MCE family protein [Maricaulaceae bacterium]
METKAHHALVGFFAVFLIAAGGFFALWLGKISFDQDYNLYEIVFDGPVRGLRETAEVRFNGIQVGEVTRIGLDPQNPNRVIARVRVTAETPVRVDSAAQLEPLGLTGLSYILITGGSADADRLYSPPGRSPPLIYARTTGLQRLLEGGEGALDTAQLALLRANELLSDENIERFSRILDNLADISGRVREEDAIVTELRAAINRIEEAAANMSEAAVALEGFGTTADNLAQNELATMVLETTAASEEVRRASEETLAMLVAIRPAIERFAGEGLDDLTYASHDLRRLIESLDRVVTEFEDNPSQFISGQPRRQVEVPR